MVLAQFSAILPLAAATRIPRTVPRSWIPDRMRAMSVIRMSCWTLILSTHPRCRRCSWSVRICSVIWAAVSIIPMPVPKFCDALRRAPDVAANRSRRISSVAANDSSRRARRAVRIARRSTTRQCENHVVVGASAARPSVCADSSWGRRRGKHLCSRHNQISLLISTGSIRRHRCRIDRIR